MDEVEHYVDLEEGRYRRLGRGGGQLDAMPVRGILMLAVEPRWADDL